MDPVCDYVLAADVGGAKPRKTRPHPPPSHHPFCLTTTGTLASSGTKPNVVSETDPFLGWKLRAANLPWTRTCSHPLRSEEHTSALHSLMTSSYATFCLTKHTHAL